MKTSIGIAVSNIVSTCSHGILLLQSLYIILYFILDNDSGGIDDLQLIIILVIAAFVLISILIVSLFLLLLWSIRCKSERDNSVH